MTRREAWIRRELAYALTAALILIGFLAAPGPRPDLGEGSRFMGYVPPGITRAEPFGFDDPDSHILIVYLNGSKGEGKPDRCDTSRPGINVPRTATELGGRMVGGYRLAVFAFCTRTKIGGFHRDEGDGVPKVVRRADELDLLLRHIAKSGFPPQRIFVMGQSAGGWAGLLVQRNNTERFAGLIAFAPAFAGYHGRRVEAWQRERDRQADFIGQAENLNALIFGFDQDRFEPVRAMTWLRDIPGVTYVALTGVTIDGIACDGPDSHGSVFKNCFRLTQTRRILDFIESSLPVPAS